MAYGPSGNADESSSRLEEQAIARRADREACVAGGCFRESGARLCFGHRVPPSDRQQPEDDRGDRRLTTSPRTPPVSISAAE